MRAIDTFISNTEDFEGYSVSKTLTTKLIPVGKTRENIDKFNILETDSLREEAFLRVKKYINNYHRVFIDENLNKCKLEKNDLEQLKTLIQKKENCSMKERKNLTKSIQSLELNLRKSIVKFFELDERFDKLFTEKLFLELLPTICNKDELEDVELFKGFTTYFSIFNKTRKNLYSFEEKNNTIAYRAINENFPIYLKNQMILDDIKENHKELFNNSIFEEFESFNLNYEVSSDFISKYNSFLSGKYDAEGCCIEKGLNQLINEYKQNKGIKIKGLKQLYKNILSEKNALFTIDCFESTAEIKAAIQDFHNNIFLSLENFKKYIKENSLDYANIYVQKKNLNTFSSITAGSVFNLQSTINDKKDFYSLKELEIFVNESNKINEKQIVFDVTKYKDQVLSFDLNKYYSKTSFEHITDIQYDKTQALDIKNYLQATLDYFNLLRIVDVSGFDDIELDEEFYLNLEKILFELNPIVKIYNKTRNFVTKSLKQEKKIKLNFDCSVLMDGWTQSVEKTKNGMLFYDSDKDKYYLGIYNQNTKKESYQIVENSSLKKMYLNMIPEPYKMLPHVCFSKKGIETFHPSLEILDGYKKGLHKKSNEVFDIDFCHKLIDYYKSCIKAREEWNCFDFNFKQTQLYNDTSEFFDDVAKGAYKVTLQNIDSEHLFKTVEEGSLFLFEIYNRYLAKKAHGSDIYTNIIRSLFDEKVNNVQLCAGAKVFYRPKLIKEEITHSKGSWIVNKVSKEGFTINSTIYKNIYNHLNYGEKLTSESETLFKSGSIIYKKADRDISKDKRYMSESFSFSFPVKINYKGKDVNTYLFNKRVNEIIKNDDNLNIISINRGEKNLIYIVIINRSGEVLLNKSLNLIQSGNNVINYKNKLEVKEKERANARTNWQEIKNIKSLKEGYLSSVVSEIVNLMLEYNAILVMESLSNEFKSKRQFIESNIYQQFEVAIINKLSCIIDKHKKNEDYGSLLHPYQLVPKFESYEKIFMQFGFIFLLNPAYISKIDPFAGLLNVFNFSELTNNKKRVDFLKKFDFIGIKADKLVFEYDLINFSKDFTGKQIVVGTGNRNIWDNDSKQIISIDINEETERLHNYFNSAINFVDLINEETNKDVLKTLIKVFSSLIGFKSFVYDEWIYISPSAKEVENKKYNIDFIAAYNLANKFRYMLSSLRESGELINIKTVDYFNKLQTLSLTE